MAVARDPGSLSHMNYGLEAAACPVLEDVDFGGGNFAGTISLGDIDLAGL